MFCEAVKVDMANSNDTSFSNTITSTLSLITVLFEDLFEAINIHKEYCGKKRTLNHPSDYWILPIHLLDMLVGLYLKGGSSTMMRLMHSKKNRCCCLRVFVSLFSGNSIKFLFVLWWK
jgi:hypothetical protein